uniref:C2H2-type domain-containing protein n=1 Tax=Cyprinus carpio TaxID=7962 RepID=A0A8C1UCJ8_CYPCA
MEIFNVESREAGEFYLASLPLSALRLVVPPLRLMSAFLWQVVQRRNVTQYGKLEQFVVLVTETVPDIMSRSLVNKLIFHLLRQVTMKICFSIFHLSLCLQHVFPVEYGSGYDAVLQSLAWEFLSRVEDLLPVPNLKETASWLCGGLSMMEEIVQPLSDPVEIKDVLQHFKTKRLHTGNNEQSQRVISESDIFLRFFFLLVCTVSIPSTAEVVCLPHPVSPTIAIEHEETLPPTSIWISELTGKGISLPVLPPTPVEIVREETIYVPVIERPPSVKSIIHRKSSPPRAAVSKKAAATPSESQTSQEEKRHSCPECHKEFRFECLLRNHMRTHTGERPFQCSDCGKSFRCLSFLTNHIKTHSLARPFKCIQCVKTFRKKADLIKHIRVHTGEKPYKCTICGKSFSQENLHQCPHCNKSFPTAFKLSIHVRYHSMERSYQCNQCGKSFIYASLLRRHKGYHAGERQHLCSICGKSFVYMFDLKKHQRNHERPRIKIPCTLCNKTFAGPEMLRCHLRIHTGERPFRCKICGKAFSQIGNMKRHERVHTGERPFTCERCGKTYKHSSHLKNHMLSHTGERPWQCSHCGKSFKFAGPLKKHERTHLGERGNRRRSYDQTDVMLNFSKLVPIKKTLHLHLGWSQGEYIFSQVSFLDELLLKVDNN